MSLNPIGQYTEQAPACWLKTLLESDDDISAGRVVPVDDVLEELDRVISEMDDIEPLGRTA